MIKIRRTATSRPGRSNTGLKTSAESAPMTNKQLDMPVARQDSHLRLRVADNRRTSHTIRKKPQTKPIRIIAMLSALTVAIVTVTSAYAGSVNPVMGLPSALATIFPAMLLLTVILIIVNLFICRKAATVGVASLLCCYSARLSTSARSTSRACCRLYRAAGAPDSSVMQSPTSPAHPSPTAPIPPSGCWRRPADIIAFRNATTSHPSPPARP